MGGYGRSRIDELKSFLSRDVDRARLKYRADVEDFPRRAAVVGSSNQLDLLKFDESGQRRFAPFIVEPRHSVFGPLQKGAHLRYEGTPQEEGDTPPGEPPEADPADTF